MNDLDRDNMVLSLSLMDEHSLASIIDEARTKRQERVVFQAEAFLQSLSTTAADLIKTAYRHHSSLLVLPAANLLQMRLIDVMAQLEKVIVAAKEELPF